MGRFAASLKTLGDRRGTPATVDLEDGRISIALGEHAIGDWSLDEVKLEPIPHGYRMTAEGEQIFLEMSDSERFASELHSKPRWFKRRSERGVRKTDEPAPRRRQKKKRRSPIEAAQSQDPVAPAETPTMPTRQADETAPQAGSMTRRSPVQPPSSQVHVAPAETPTVPTRGADKSAPTAEPMTPTAAKESFLVRASVLLDGVIDAAESRWGALLPQWVFTRSTFFAVMAILVLAFVFPGYSTLILLAAGLIAVTLGAVLYSDSILAAKWLPGRMTPKHVLVSGITVLVFGVLLGVIAT